MGTYPPRSVIMELTSADIEVLLESLKFSIPNVSDAPRTPYAVRRENLNRLEEVQQKLQKLRDTQQ
jgi:vacuolar-type H+-ATPase subunit I/STV1